MIKIFPLEMSFCVNIIFIIFSCNFDLEVGDKLVFIYLVVVSCKRSANYYVLELFMLLLWQKEMGYHCRIYT